jgi:undecaprenyl-diphosphatase
MRSAEKCSCTISPCEGEDDTRINAQDFPVMFWRAANFPIGNFMATLFRDKPRRAAQRVQAMDNFLYSLPDPTKNNTAMQNIFSGFLRNFPLKLIQLLRGVGKVEKSVLVAFAIAASALYAFSELADEVIEGETREFDEFILRLLRNPLDLSDPLGPAWLEEMMRDFTALGGTGVLTAITLAVVGFLALTRKHHSAVLIAGSVIGGMLLSNLFKWAFARPRPDLVPHLSVVYTESFPSGHAMLSAVVFLTLGVLLARMQADVRVKTYLLAVAATATMIVGASRVYLGVHWPTDVLAGWAVGTGWALICWLLMLWLQKRGKVEPEENGGDENLPAGRP